MINCKKTFQNYFKKFLNPHFGGGYSLQPPGYVPAREGNQSPSYVHHVRYFQAVSGTVISAKQTLSTCASSFTGKPITLGLCGPSIGGG